MSWLLQWWKAIPDDVRMSVSAAAPALVMMATARKQGFSDVATILWGGTAAFSGAVLQEAITGDTGDGFILESAAMLEQAYQKHPIFMVVSTALGTIVGVAIIGIGGLTLDVLFPELFGLELFAPVIPLIGATASAASAGAASAFSNTAADTVTGFSAAALLTAVGSASFVFGIGGIYAVQGIACGARFITDPLHFHPSKQCEFGPSKPLWPSS